MMTMTFHRRMVRFFWDTLPWTGGPKNLLLEIKLSHIFPFYYNNKSL